MILPVTASVAAGYVTVGGAMKITGWSRSRIVRLCDRKVIPSERIEGDAAGRRVLVEPLRAYAMTSGA